MTLVTEPTSVSSPQTATECAPRPDQALTPGLGRWPFRLTLLATILTWPLLFVGGMVTTYRVGMAVPDWPTTFGVNMFLYDFINASWGVFVEHGHRLLGAGVGLVVLGLSVYLMIADPRKWMKLLALAVLVGVISQGVLGGYRVRLNSTELAMVHGITGQIFFSLMVALCVLTSRRWSPGLDRPVGRPDRGQVRLLSVFLLFAVESQIVLGAWLRHFGSLGALMMHAGFSLVVLGLGAWMVIQGQRLNSSAVAWPARWLGLGLVIQISLGVASWWVLRPFDGIPRTVDAIEAVIRTGHQANGALLLASATVLAMQAGRFLHGSGADGLQTNLLSQGSWLDSTGWLPGTGPRLHVTSEGHV